MLDDIMAQIEARAKRFGPMRDANAYATIRGECGDTAEVWLRIDGGKVRKGSYMTDGCRWSKLCCNKAVELAEGMTLEQAGHLTPAQVLNVTGPVPADHHHCALLAADTVRLAVENYGNTPEKIPLSEHFKRALNRKRHDQE